MPDVRAMEYALEACADYFDRFADVMDGDYGVPEPNEEMRLLALVLDALGER